MGFTELAGIKLPKALFEAAKSGELVVFAGAGVSMQGKTPLPDFGSLVEGVSQKVDAERKLNPFDKKNDSCEEYLGELETLYGEAVRTECTQMLSAGTCAEVHRHIISLFECIPSNKSRHFPLSIFDTCLEHTDGLLYSFFSFPSISAFSIL